MIRRTVTRTPGELRALRAARAHLRRVDPVLAEIIGRVGNEPPRRGLRGFEGLGSAIVYQQVSGAAGDSIVRRLRRQARATAFPPPRFFLSSSTEELRRCGLSPQKLAYLRDLAAHIEEGRLDLRQMGRLADEEVIARLCDVRGIGRWTAEMYLMFALGRPDVLPVDDLGLRKGVARAYGFRALPAASTILRLGERWRPHRSLATHYLWRVLEREPWAALERAAVSLRGTPGPRAEDRIEIPKRP